MSRVDEIMSNALASANRHEADVSEFHRLERLRRMQVLVKDIEEWLDESDDAALLAEAGVSWQLDEGVLRFEQAGRELQMVPRDDMSISVGGAIMHPNRDCPVLTRPFHRAAMACVLHFAMLGAAGDGKAVS